MIWNLLKRVHLQFFKIWEKGIVLNLFLKKNVLLFSVLILLGVFFTSCACINKRSEVTYNYLDVNGNPDVFIDYIHEPLPVDYTIDFNCQERVGEKLFTGWQDESGNIYKNSDTITLKDNLVLTAVYA